MKVEFRRNMPHIYVKDAVYNIVFRLHGTLPNKVLSDYILEKEKLFKAKKSKLLQGLYNDTIDAYLNNSKKLDYLANPEILTIVKESIHFYQEKSFKIICYSIMPNHVHLLINTMNFDFVPLGELLGSIKKYSARRANAILNMNGHFWQIENYDHVVRSRNELSAILIYNINNPVSAGLVSNWQDWNGTFVDERYLEA